MASTAFSCFREALRLCKKLKPAKAKKIQVSNYEIMRLLMRDGTYTRLLRVRIYSLVERHWETTLSIIK